MKPALNGEATEGAPVPDPNVVPWPKLKVGAGAPDSPACLLPGAGEDKPKVKGSEAGAMPKPPKAGVAMDDVWPKLGVDAPNTLVWPKTGVATPNAGAWPNFEVASPRACVWTKAKPGVLDSPKPLVANHEMPDLTGQVGDEKGFSPSWKE